MNCEKQTRTTEQAKTNLNTACLFLLFIQSRQALTQRSVCSRSVILSYKTYFSTLIGEI